MARGQRDPKRERFWRDVLRRHKGSGLTVRAFCAREHLAETAFHAWRRILRERDAERRPAPVPAKFEVLQHVRHKYACKHCGDGKCQACDGRAHIDIATREAAPIEKGLAGPGLVAYVITSKLGDHLPLYRLETIFDRAGIDIARSTMCAWMLSAGKLVKPLTDRMAERVRQSDVIHTDETRVPVQDGTTKGKCKSGRIWTYIGDETNPFVDFDYTPDRTRAGPMAWLDKFGGYLQADAYGGYDGIYATGVTEVACWAHARRKFFDAKGTDGARAAQMLEYARRLYAVEDEANPSLRMSSAKRMLRSVPTAADQ